MKMFSNKKVYVFLALFLGLFCLAMPIHSAINEQISFQGKLANSSGVSVSDGNYDIVFALYTVSSGGSAIWTENHTTANGNPVAVEDGIFTAMLGSDSSLSSINLNQTLYLGITVGTDSEMTPRKIIGAVPQSIVSKYLETASGSGAVAGTSADNVLLLDSEGDINLIDNALIYTDGIYARDSGGLALYEASGIGLFIEDGGNVGIGTTNPDSKLEIYGSSGSASLNLVTLDNDGLGSGTGSAILFKSGLFNGAKIEALKMSETGSPTNLVLYTGYDGTLTETMTLASGGYVGIGVTNPLSLVHIGTSGTPSTIDGVNDVYIYDDLEVDGTIYGDGSGLTGVSASTTPGGTDGMLQYNDGGSTMGGTNGLYWDDVNSRVGIGTTSPEKLVDIYKASPSSNEILFQIGKSSDSNLFYVDAEGDVLTEGKIYFDGDSTEYIYMALSDFYVTDSWIPTSSSYDLGGSTSLYRWGTAYIRDEINIGGTSDFGGIWYEDSTNDMFFGTDGVTTADMALDSSGYFSIGNDNPLSLLHIGSAGTPGSVDGVDDVYIYDDLEVDGTIYGDGSGLTGVSASASPGGTDGMIQYNDGGSSIGGTNGLYWDDVNLRLGVGTTSPSAILDVKTSDSVVFQYSSYLYLKRSLDSTGSPQTRFVKSRGTLDSRSTVVSGDGLGSLEFYGYDGTADILGATIEAVIDSAVGTNDLPTRLVFSTTADGGSTSVERMRIDSAGNIGIGISNPSQLLEVSKDNGTGILSLRRNDTNNAIGSDVLFGSLQFTSNAGTSTPVEFASIRAYTDDTSSATDDYPSRLSFWTTADTSGTSSERMRIDSSGNVGIGTTSPDRLLQIGSRTSVSTSTPDKLSLGSTYGDSVANSYKLYLFDGSSASYGFGVSTYQLNYMASSTDYDHVFYSGGNELVRVEGTGNVGIGTSSPTYMLDVYKSFDSLIQIDSGSGVSYLDFANAGSNEWGIGISGNAGLSRSNFYLLEDGSSSYPRLTVKPGGYFGINDTDPAVALDVIGSIYYTGTITDVSDIRLKENIVYLENSLEKLLDLDTFSFNMIGDDLSLREIGLSAQQVKEVFPEAVSFLDENNDYLGIDYTQLVPPLIQAIQQQQIQIEELGILVHNDEFMARLEDLEGEVAGISTLLDETILYVDSLDSNSADLLLRKTIAESTFNNFSSSINWDNVEKVGDSYTFSALIPSQIGINITDWYKLETHINFLDISSDLEKIILEIYDDTELVSSHSIMSSETDLDLSEVFNFESESNLELKVYCTSSSDNCSFTIDNGSYLLIERID